MSESILRALMQLFALVAKVEGVSKDGRSIVKLFLKKMILDCFSYSFKFYDKFVSKFLLFFCNYIACFGTTNLPMSQGAATF